MKRIENPAVLNAAQKFRAERGFSLVELVLTLVLIGIIAAVAVAKYVNLSEKPRRPYAGRINIRSNPLKTFSSPIS